MRHCRRQALKHHGLSLEKNNMKYDISCSGVAIGKTQSLETTLDIMAEAGFDTIDFWLYVYSESEDAPLRKENWREWVDYAADCMKKRGIVPGQCHCQWVKGHAFSEEFTIEPPKEILHRSIEACHMLGCHRLVFHPPYYHRRILNDETRIAILDGQVEWFRHFLPTAEKFGVEIHLENTFDSKHTQKEGDPYYVNVTAWEMLHIANKLNHPLVKICIDTGHARIANQDVPAMIREIGPLLGSVHLNDNFGLIGPIYEDLHLFPGYGDLDWDAIFAALKEINYSGTLNMEPGSPLRNGVNEDQVVKLRSAKALVRTMAERAGFEVN